MATETTTKGKIGKLQRLLARLESNREELQHMEPSRIRLQELFNQLQEAADRQATHTAAKQEASKQVQSFLLESERLATILQLAVKQHYGIRSEKLVDFGLKVFRGHKPMESLRRLISENFFATEPQRSRRAHSAGFSVNGSPPSIPFWAQRQPVVQDADQIEEDPLPSAFSSRTCALPVAPP